MIIFHNSRLGAFASPGYFYWTAQPFQQWHINETPVVQPGTPKEFNKTVRYTTSFSKTIDYETTFEKTIRYSTAFSKTVGYN